MALRAAKRCHLYPILLEKPNSFEDHRLEFKWIKTNGLSTFNADSLTSVSVTLCHARLGIMFFFMMVQVHWCNDAAGALTSKPSIQTHHAKADIGLLDLSGSFALQKY